MKKFIVFLLAFTLLSAMPLSVIAAGSEASDSSSDIPDNAVVTFGYLEQFKEKLKAEIIAELLENGISSAGEYSDITVEEGQFIYLSADSEVIFRGGAAVAITASNLNGDGFNDMSQGIEIFSGEALEYGHIYFATEADSRRAILVTGDKAFFTVRGNYEIG